MTAPVPVPSRRWRRPRFWLVVLLALVVLAGTAVGGVGWYYSGQLQDVSHAPDPYDLRVLAVGGDSVTLPDTPATARPGIFGLAWRGGSAVLGEVVRRERATVTRTSVGASPPPGAPARLVAAVWDGDPRTARGLAYSAVGVPDPLGSMPAWYVHATRSTWVVMVRALALASPSVVTFVEVQQADHTEGWNVDPPAYEAAVARFLAAR